MTPYYEQGDIRLYLGDSRENLPAVAQGGLVVTDPPYNVGYHYDGYRDNLKADDYQELLRLTCRTPSVIIHYPEDICALSWTLEELPAEMVAWVYNSNTARQHRSVAWFGCAPDFRLDGQDYKNPEDRRVAALMAEGRQARLYDWWQMDQVKNVSAEKTGWPCQIPVALMWRILKITPAKKIVDPFVGSGSTMVAARDLGIAAVGIDQSELACEITAKRLSQQLLEY